MRWPETLIRNWADRFAQKRAAASHQAPTFRPRAGCSKHRQSGFVHLSMLLARWGKRPLSVQQLFASNASAPGLHFETYDPNTILRRRNLLTRTRELADAVWVRTGLTSVTNNAGGATGKLAKLVESAVNEQHVLNQQPVNLFVGDVLFNSIRAKAAERTRVNLESPNGAAYGGTVPYISVNLLTGDVLFVSSSIADYGVEDLGSGEYRIWTKAVCTVAGTSGLRIGMLPASGFTSTYAGDGASGVLIGEAQSEKGSRTAYQEITDWNTEFMAAGGERVTMFQDSTCSTPVTKPEDPIGGFISSERGTARGPQLIPDPEFDNPSQWVIVQPTAGSASISGGAFTFNTTDGSITNANPLNGAVNIVAGRAYEFEMMVSAVSGGGVAILIGNTQANFTTTGLKRGVLVAVASGSNNIIQVKRVTGACSATVEYVTVRELPSKIATQTTAGFKPKLDARVNASVSTEDLSAAAWTKTSVTISGTKTLVETVASSSHQVTQTATGFPAGNCKLAVDLVPVGRTWAYIGLFDGGATNRGGFVNLATGAVGITENGATIATQAITGGYRCTVSVPLSSASPLIVVGAATGDGGRSYAGTGIDAIQATKIDLRTSADTALDIPAYQRVNTSTDYDWTGFPMRVRGDGSDDYLSVPLNMSTTNKVTAWIGGELKKSDASAAILFELTAISSGTAGGIAVIAPDGAANYSWRSNGNPASANKTTSGANLPAPRSDVLTCEGDIANDVMTLYVNGTVVASSSADQGTGNYANDTLYILARAGSSLRSSCGWTALTIFGGTCTAGQRAAINRRHARLAKVKL